MNQGKLDVVKQKIVRLNIDISGLKAKKKRAAEDEMVR